MVVSCLLSPFIHKGGVRWCLRNGTVGFETRLCWSCALWQITVFFFQPSFLICKIKIINSITCRLLWRLKQIIYVKCLAPSICSTHSPFYPLQIMKYLEFIFLLYLWNIWSLICEKLLSVHVYPIFNLQDFLFREGNQRLRFSGLPTQWLN